MSRRSTCWTLSELPWKSLAVDATAGRVGPTALAGELGEGEVGGSSALAGGTLLLTDEEGSGGLRSQETVDLQSRSQVPASLEVAEGLLVAPLGVDPKAEPAEEGLGGGGGQGAHLDSFLAAAFLAGAAF